MQKITEQSEYFCGCDSQNMDLKEATQQCTE